MPAPIYELITYQVAVLLTAILLYEAVSNSRQLRWIYAGLVYLVTVLWYLIDPVYTPKDYARFTPEELDTAFTQVIVFLLAFRVLMGVIVRKTPTLVLRSLDPAQFDKASVVRSLLLAWFALWMIGVVLARFEVLDLMLPLKGRFGGVTMFGRGRFGGSTGFLLSAAGYIYLVLCSGFGLLYVCSKRSSVRMLMLLMICFTWPMYFLAGTRHLALAVGMPAIFAALLIKPWTRAQQVGFVIVCALVLNIAMLAAIQYRQRGFASAIEQGTITSEIQDAHHQGLNMTQELVFMNRYQEAGMLPIEWGNNYLGHFLNFVPRAIWADKPFVGREFALLRVGKYKGDVSATISFGFIGQGVANFGGLIGPLAPAFLLTFLGQWIVSLPTHGFQSLRILLVLFIFGSLPNLGRDISLFVLWPIVFAHVIVVLYEHNTALSQRRPAYRPQQTRHVPGGIPPPERQIPDDRFSPLQL